MSLPSIERHNDAGPPLYHDPSPGAALSGASDGTGEDHFTFEGKALVPICLIGGISAAGNGNACPEGEPMPAWATGGWHYFRLEADVTFQRFFWSPDHNTWVVQQRSGNTLELGSPMDDPTDHAGNDIDPTIATCPSCAPATFRWHLVRQFDAMGPDVNVIYYKWQPDPLSTSTNPQNLNYLTDVFDTPAPHGDSGGSGSGPWGANLDTHTFAHHVHVTWTQDDQSSPPSGGLPVPLSAVAVWRQVPTRLLSRVDMTSFAKDRSVPRHLVRSYALDYFERGSGSVSFQRALLKAVTTTGECPTNEQPGNQLLEAAPSCAGGTLPPMTMTYTSGGLNLSPTGATNLSGQWGISNGPRGTLMDVNGDGLPDYVGPVQTITGIDIPIFGDCSLFSNNQSIVALNNVHNPSGMFGGGSIAMSLPSPALGVTLTSLVGTSSTLQEQWSTQWAIGNWSTPNGSPAVTALWWNAAATNSQVYQADLSSAAWTKAQNPMLPSGSGLAALSPATILSTFGDLDGDGLLDWIRQDPGTTKVSAFFTSQDGFGNVEPLHRRSTSLPAVITPDQCGGGPLCTDPNNCTCGNGNPNFFVDVNGDGAPDFVYLLAAPGSTFGHPNPLQIWVTRGHGDASFDTQSYILGELPANLSFEIEATSPIAGSGAMYLHDINGDGLADVVFNDSSGVHLFLSTGHSFEAEIAISNNFGFHPIPNTDCGNNNACPTNTITFADMNGSGIDDIVLNTPRLQSYHATYGTRTCNGIFTSGETIQYIDLLDGAPQGLLASVSNGFGAKTVLEYTSSVESSNTSTPQVMHLVSRQTTTINDPSGMAGGPYETEFKYLGPVYDTRHRSFVGFEHVIATKINRTRAPGGYGTGGPNGHGGGPSQGPQGNEVVETFFALANACPSPCQQLDEPIQAIRGLPVFTTVHTPDGVFLSAIHHEYRLQSVFLPSLTTMDGREVRYAYDEQTDTWLFDTAVGPQGGLAPVAVLDVDDQEGAANPNTQTRLSLNVVPLGASFVELESKSVEDATGNPVSTTDRGVIMGPTLDKAIDYSASWARQGDKGNWLWRATELSTSGGSYSRRNELHYDSNGNLRLVQGDLSGTRALHRFHENPLAAIALPPVDRSADGTHQMLAQMDVDSFGNVFRATSGNGNCTTAAFDPVFQQLPTSSTQYPAGCGSGPTLTTMRSYDRGFGVVTQAIAADNTATSFVLDLFGRVIEVHMPNPDIPGMSETQATTRVHYDTPVGGPFQLVTTEQRDDQGGSASPNYRTSWSLLDGLGRTAAMVSQADKANDPHSMIVSGLTQRDDVGLVERAYIPFFSDYKPTTKSLPSPGATESYAFVHDAFGRLTETSQLNGARDSDVVYHALSEDIYDATDLAGGVRHPLTMTSDGHGRTVQASQPTSSGGVSGASSDVLTTTATYLPTGEVTSVTRSNAAGSSVSRTMTYDTMGRMVFNSEPNTSSGGHGWTYAYDISDQLVGTTDARGCGVNYAYDGVGRVVSEDYSPCLNSQPIYTTPQPDGDGTEAFFHYDSREPGQSTDYGVNPIFLQGKLGAASDRAQHSRYGYDGRGRLIGLARQLAQPGAAALTSLPSRYTPSWYRTAAAYDEADRPIAQSTGADVASLQGTAVTMGSLTSTSLVSVAYDDRDIPVQVGGSYGTLVNNDVRWADGLLKSREYGDSAKTTATCNYNKNRWLTEALISRKGVTPDILLDAKYSKYDAVGNATKLTDNRNYKQWPTGAQPVSRTLAYDDLYRLRGVDYTYLHDDTQKPLFGASDLSPIPGTLPPNRVQKQFFDFDWQHNLVSSRDDLNDTSSFFTRSVGTETYGSATSGPNQVRSVTGPGGSATVEYDPAGNITSIVEPYSIVLGGAPNPSFQLNYAWDEAGRLSSASRSDFSGTAFNGTTTIIYAYDASGQRVSKGVTEGFTIGPGATKYFLEIFPSLRVNATTWDDATGDYDRDETTETAYLLANGASYGRIVYDDTVPKTGTSALHVYLQVTDALGSTSSVIDLASSELVEQVTYLPNGGAESDYRPVAWNSFRESYRYTGKEDDYQVGLIYYGQRYLSSGLGRWASPDPLNIHGLGGGSNPYAFVRGSPLRFTDPVGYEDDGGDQNGGGDAAAAGGTPPGPAPPSVPAPTILDNGALLLPYDEVRSSSPPPAPVLTYSPATPAGGGPGGTPGAGTPPDGTTTGIMNAEQNAAGVQTPGRLSFGQQFREVGRLASRQLAEPQWMQASRSIGLDIVFAGARVPRLIWGAASAIQAVRSGNNAGALAGVAAIGLGGAVGAFSSRGLRAADLGLSGTGITNLVGEVTNAGTTRIVSVASITAANNALLGELRGAVPNMLSAARAEGVKTLQITASFGNDRLASFAASQAAKYQGVFSSVAGQDVITFVLGAAK